MRGKLMLVAGLATGYVLGSRAGRKRYDQIAKGWNNVWHSKPVQAQVHKVGDFAKDNAPAVVGFVAGTVKKLASGSAQSTTASKPATKTAARKTAARKPARRKPTQGASASSE